MATAVAARAALARLAMPRPAVVARRASVRRRPAAGLLGCGHPAEEDRGHQGDRGARVRLHARLQGRASANSDHFSIPVMSPAAVSTPPHEAAEDDGQVVTLDAKLYRQMPPTMQKMSVMGKVIIVTG